MKLNNNNLIVDFFKNISAYVSNSPILYVFEIIIRFVAALATLILSVILIVKFAADTEEKRVSITYILIVVLRIFIIYFLVLFSLYFLKFIIYMLTFSITILKLYGPVTLFMYRPLEMMFGYINLYVNMFLQICYHTGVVVILSQIAGIILIVCILLYIIWIILKDIPFINIIVQGPPFKELEEEGIFAFLSQIFASTGMQSIIKSVKEFSVVKETLKGLSENQRKVQENFERMEKQSKIIEKFVDMKLEKIQTLKKIKAEEILCYLDKYKVSTPGMSEKEKVKTDSNNKSIEFGCKALAKSREYQASATI